MLNDDTFKTFVNQEYYVEVMVVADMTVYQYHKNEERLKHYILTLMSHVALLFKDASIGNPISLSVVKIWILKDISFASSWSSEMLQKFCDWQNVQVHDYPHDVALLLTRGALCKQHSDSSCNLLGVAQRSSMCSSNSCAIVKDKGLSTSFTIAHELGHLLSMSHDDGEDCVKFNDSPIKGIMNKIMLNDSEPWTWSSCSKSFLSHFLESGKSDCLLDQPSKDLVTANFQNVLPGEHFEVDLQCQLEFGRGSKVCSFMPPCGSLWCTTELMEQEGCKTQTMPWADGTSCGHNSWCHRGKCVALDRGLLKPLAGGWGPWQAWEPCTRTCGGGVKMSRRSCDSPRPANGGMYCIGRSVRYVSCNTKPCDASAPDFRELQCAEHNNKNKGIPGVPANVKWIPKYGKQDADDLCRLYCRIQGDSNDYILNDKVIDGTKCGLTSFGICVNGICRPGGCDNKLESKTELDACGVCGGDNSTCEEIQGSFNDSVYGYNRVVKIPKGSLNIHIYQRGHRNSHKDDNYLALVDGETGHYILNGNRSVSLYLKDIIYGGLTIRYSGSDSVVEEISTPPRRKLKKDLYVEVLSAGKVWPPDITYKYTISKHIVPKFGWKLYKKVWSPCNSICGGVQYMQPNCMNLTSGLPVLDVYCSEFENHHLVQSRDCNTHCQLEWNVVARGQCDVHCGQGVRTVSYNCIKIDTNQPYYTENFKEVVDDQYCNVLPKPAKLETCQGPCNKPRWEYGEWSQCSKTCGVGTRTRSAHCIDNQRQAVDNSYCSYTEKHVSEFCNTDNCPYWTEGGWSSCSATCDKGYKTREYYCNVGGRVIAPEACDLSSRPNVTVACEERACARWTTGKWGGCSVTCDQGVQTRKVYCWMWGKVASEKNCKGYLKPNGTRVCVKDPCPEIGSFVDTINSNAGRRSTVNKIHSYHASNNIGEYRWISGAWTQCSKTCGGGYMARAVVCRDGRGDEFESMCDRNEKPKDEVPCNMGPCPVKVQHRDKPLKNEDKCNPKTNPGGCDNNNYEWKVGKWDRCSETCGKGRRRRTVSCIALQQNVEVVDSFCGHTKKPKTIQNCERYNCEYAWIEGPWSECSEMCGDGIKTRTVTCHRISSSSNGFVIDSPVHPLSCYGSQKPITKRMCKDRNCNDNYFWTADPWGDCMPFKGRKGRKIRNLHCKSRDGRKVGKTLCPRNLKPRRKQKCLLHKSCIDIKYGEGTKKDGEYKIWINKKQISIYCHRMDTAEPQEFITLKNENNYAEYFNKRLVDIETCQSRENCDCTSIGPDRYGLTSFQKVRINITTMLIIPNDFSFSYQLEGRQIDYGSAGDCYSMSRTCPQGRFSIDLRDTSFRLSKSIRWVSKGQYASMEIDKSDYIAVGQCGGYCGQCVPDPSVGLLLEVT
ncbi:A disintegrin and metalloproteinase with thrombospondin motifs 9-like [Agrilus planipennis]|uniref:A disintegrin and metalloproteinase with thrombospondin motifs 9-like n=1 Tax=Agrilus planipennis TaxID=224129 RepID=A0A1W4WL61_AGRPL|nr:A disintegrin and metalloproteinase with thrombospondin motifs 9-like [Agrilus planipennis]